MTQADLYLFTSPTCPHCPATADFAQRYASEHEDVVLTHYSSTDPAGQEAAARLGVQSVPTIIIDGPHTDNPIGLRGLPAESVVDKAVRVARGEIDIGAMRPGLWEQIKALFGR